MTMSISQQLSDNNNHKMEKMNYYEKSKVKVRADLQNARKLLTLNWCHCYCAVFCTAVVSFFYCVGVLFRPYLHVWIDLFPVVIDKVSHSGNCFKWPFYSIQAATNTSPYLTLFVSQ